VTHRAICAENETCAFIVCAENETCACINCAENETCACVICVKNETCACIICAENETCACITVLTRAHPKDHIKTIMMWLRHHDVARRQMTDGG
jgi:hypothetical protein